MKKIGKYITLVLGIVLLATGTGLLFTSKENKVKEKNTGLEKLSIDNQKVKELYSYVDHTKDSSTNGVFLLKNQKVEVAAETKEVAVADIKKIIFACDAGMGSSAMGASVLKKKIAEAGIEGIEVIHTPVSSIPPDVQIVVTHQELGERAARSNPNAELVLITNFLAAPEYKELVEKLKE